MTAETYRSYARQSTEDKLRALSPEAIAHEREKALVMVNLWRGAGENDQTHGQYRRRLALIDSIIEEGER